MQFTTASWPSPYSSAGPFTSGDMLGMPPGAGVVELRVWVGSAYVGSFTATVQNPFERGTCPGAGADCPQIVGPASGIRLPDLGTTLRWLNPTGTTQVHVRVLPAGSDGPGINMILGSPITSFVIPEPVFGVGSYTMLPGMTYTWQARVTSQVEPAGETSNAWGSWSDPFTFRTRTTSSDGIALASPSDGGAVATRTPTLRWTDADTAIFYYEVQVSADPTFTTDPATATKAVYWNLIHGGLTNPLNSYTVPQAYALTAAMTYHWRVRARIQGDGIPVAWSRTSSFRTP